MKHLVKLVRLEVRCIESVAIGRVVDENLFELPLRFLEVKLDASNVLIGDVFAHLRPAIVGVNHRWRSEIHLVNLLLNVVVVLSGRLDLHPSWW